LWFAAPVSAELRPLRTQAHPGDTVEYRIVNHGPETLTFGAPYILERRGGDDWVECNEEKTWTVPLFSLGPGKERTEWARIPSDGAPGRYRVTKEVTAGEYDQVLSFELDVAPDR
jgi:Bacterial Ig-like domain